MDKQKKVFLISATCVVALAQVALVVLLVLDIVSLALGLGLITGGLALEAAAICLMVLWPKKKKAETKPVVIDASDPSGMTMIDLYGILGIPPQYNKDGSIKDIFELLGIEPEFDENGNRLLTVYEQLGVTPKFSADGKEIPTVVVIKNRVGSIAKVDLNSRVLTRKLTDKEKEEIIITETLKKKLDEAEKNGNKEQQEAIKKVIIEKQAPKKAEKQKEPAPIKFKVKGNDKPKASIVGFKSIKPKQIPLDVAISGWFAMAGASAAKKIADAAKAAPQTPPKKEPVPAPAPRPAPRPAPAPAPRPATPPTKISIGGSGLNERVRDTSAVTVKTIPLSGVSSEAGRGLGDEGMTL